MLDTPLPQFDVLIVGGGWVGVSLALMLPPAWRVAIVEAQPLSQLTAATDNRTLVLACASQAILTTLKIWPLLESKTTPIRQVSISGKNHFATCHLLAEEFGLSALGYTLAAPELTQALHAVLRQHTNIVWYSPAKVTDLTFVDGKPRVKITVDGKEEILNAALCVAADGVHSKIRQLLRIPVKIHDYHQTAITANVQLARSHQQQATERFLPTGPLAMLPREANTAALVWCMPAQQASAMLEWTDQAFLRALQQALGYRLGRLLQVTPRSSFPIHLLEAQQLTRQGIVLIGSAACHLHPIAAQSFNLALRDAAALAELLWQAWQQGELPGDWRVLKNYEARRHAEKVRAVKVTDGAVRLFAHTFLPLQLLRGAGLLAIDLLPVAKRQLIRQAVGLSNQPGKLIRGLPLV